MKNLIIVGGGASGITCAIKAKQMYPQLNVIILEKNDRIGKKILKTGNGKCNISNTDLKSSYYNQRSFIERCYNKVSFDEVNNFFKNLGLFVKNDTSTRLYPYSESATTVIEVFRYELNRLDVIVKTNHTVLNIQKRKNFIVETDQGVFESDFLVIATGSIAQEKTNGYEILSSLGHKITSLKPGLVPLKTKENLKSIQGIRIKCRASVINNNVIVHQEDGEILFKEKGLSGVLALNLSRYISENSIVSLDIFPDNDLLAKEIKKIMKHKNLEDSLLGILPKMLVYEVLKRNPDKDLNQVIKTLHFLKFHILDTYGYEQAQITIGGLDINDINEDFSSKKIENLYIIGEVLDVDGSCGGYNLHFAWVSGIIAAQSINFEKN